MHKFELVSEEVAFTYTSKKARCEDIAGSAQHTRAHSKHFHLKIHVPLKFALDLMPAMQVFGNSPETFWGYAKQLEPLRYQLEKRGEPWQVILQKILDDATIKTHVSQRHHTVQ